MPMDLLHALAHADMPVEFANPMAQRELRILHDAGHIICSFPRTGAGGPTCVHRVTALGRKALRHYGTGSAAFT
jgi:hypothetical protein